MAKCQMDAGQADFKVPTGQNRETLASKTMTVSDGALTHTSWPVDLQLPALEYLCLRAFCGCQALLADNVM